jgi:glucose/arabinose dehydrogenase
VPDYLTSVREGAFYGWPYSHFGQNEDPRKKGQRPDLVAKAIKPDYALGSHVAALGLAFYRGNSFPQRYHGGAFIGMHGSFNRSKMRMTIIQPIQTWPRYWSGKRKPILRTLAVAHPIPRKAQAIIV